MATSAKISFGLYDTSAKADSVPAAGNVQPFVNLEDLKLEGQETPKIATLEQDFFLLDGSFDLFPDAPEGQFWGLWSDSMSDARGAFAVPPQLTIQFSQPHSSVGLTLRFYEATGDYPSRVTARWLDAGGYVLAQGDYHPDSANWMLENKVEGYYQIILTFHSTRRPYRYLKLAEIQYGARMVFSGEDITAASLLEEVDPLSAQISVNTLDFTLHSRNAAFSVLNPKGIFSLLQQGQQLDVARVADGTETPLGTLYLDEWENQDESSITMRAIDRVGVMDKTRFMGGLYSNVEAASLIAELMASAGVDYQLDEALANLPVSGWIPVCTHREALQQVAFAIGAVVDCSRSQLVKIYAPPVRPTSRITYARKFIGQSLKVRPLITGVDVAAYTYHPGGETRELLNEELQPGEYEVLFDAPTHSLAITGASILYSGANYARLQVDTSGPVLLTGVEYARTKRMISRRMASQPANTAANILTVEEATLVGPGNAAAVAQRVFDYHQQRYENEFSMVVGGETVSDMVMVDSLNREKLKGVVETMHIDLTGGFIAKIKVCGMRIETLAADYTGELYAGEHMGVM